MIIILKFPVSVKGEIPILCFFDRLTEVKEAPKTGNSVPKVGRGLAPAVRILERGKMRSKSKHLAQQALLVNPSVNCLKSAIASSPSQGSLFPPVFETLF